MAPGGDVLLWPGFTFDYWRRTRAIDLAAYQLETQEDLDRPLPDTGLVPAVAS
jgi:hypothetical protein